MGQLNDEHIRAILIEKLNNQKTKPKAIIEELRIHNGNAIADVVALYKEAHCFEIKGDGDKVDRALKQGKYFNSSFRRITLVTTSKHIDRAIDVLPKFWGMIVAKKSAKKIILNHTRKALNNPYFDKNIALLTLWKSEMLRLVEGINNASQRDSRQILAQLISHSKRKIELSLSISSMLFSRQSQNNLQI